MTLPKILCVFALFWSVNCEWCEKSLGLAEKEPRLGDYIRADLWQNSRLISMFFDVDHVGSRCGWCRKELTWRGMPPVVEVDL